MAKADSDMTDTIIKHKARSITLPAGRISGLYFVIGYIDEFYTEFQAAERWDNAGGGGTVGLSVGNCYLTGVADTHIGEGDGPAGNHAAEGSRENAVDVGVGRVEGDVVVELTVVFDSDGRGEERGEISLGERAVVEVMDEDVGVGVPGGSDTLVIA